MFSCKKNEDIVRKMTLHFYSESGNISYTLPSQTGSTYKNYFEVEFIVTDKLMSQSMYIEATRLDVYVNGSLISKYDYKEVYKKSIPVTNLYYGSK